MPLIKFKRQKVSDLKQPQKPKPVPARDLMWDHTKVPTPEPKRRLDKFKKRRDFVIIIQYREGLKKHSDYQKLGFKIEGSFVDAAVEADRLAQLLSQAISVDLHEMRKERLCRVLALYEITAFKDWSKENGVSEKANEHVRAAIKQSRKEAAKPISYYKEVKDIRVR